jgi:aminopeptidase N
MNKHFALTFFALVFSVFINAQTFSKKAPQAKENIPLNTRQEYSWWNTLHYTIDITPNYERRFLQGTNSIKFIALQSGKKLQIDLQEPMKIKRIIWKGKPVSFENKQKDEYVVSFPREIKAGETQTISVHFEGQPRAALKPPYDNGWIWAKDQKDRPWMSIACEGSGASIWLPCKDVLYDEPDNGTLFSITVPDTLTAVANGKLKRKSINKNGKVSYTWEVVNPINSYNIIPYIGKYVNWQQDYAGLQGKLDCNFWVLDYSLDKAKGHLKQTDTMLHAFEYWMGPYPFYKDGYKLVEAPMPGMEHQSAVAYGNGFQNGYGGKDFISGSGWGLKWDFILVHESGHEWFGNSITSSNHGDTWIHEGFTKYLETLYTSYAFGNVAGNEYALGTWKRIKNDEPILGSNTSDKYYKASAMLHTIRQILGDSAFRGWLHGLNQTFYHQTVNTDQILNSLNQYTKKDFSKVFMQYLKTTQVPVLEYFFMKGELHYRWANCVQGFAMPLSISVDNETFQSINPTSQWQILITPEVTLIDLSIEKNYYVLIKKEEKV